MTTETTREDLEDADEVYVGGVEENLDAEAFVQAIHAIDEVEATITEVQRELTSLLDTGLDREDAERLIYARNHNLALREVEDVFDEIEAFGQRDPMKLAARLLASKTENTIAQSEEILADLATLAERYPKEPDT